MTLDAPRRVFVAGHNGMVGSALCRHLSTDSGVELITRNRSDLNLSDQQAVADFFSHQHIDQVYLAAAKVGGIHANNTYPADFISQNLAIELSVIDAAFKAEVGQLLFLGSSCIYPRDSSQPINEEQLLTGPLEPTNEQYAIAKIAGIKLCEGYNRQHGTDYRSVMPTNLYGPGDNFHPENSHVVPALIRRFHEAVERGDDEIVIWGTGTPMREFLHVDDMAAACVHVMSIAQSDYDAVVSQRCSHVNVGTGVDCTIRELAETISRITHFKGQLVFDTSKPDGTPRKLLDVARIHNLGWQHEIDLETGLQSAYDWFKDPASELRSK